MTSTESTSTSLNVDVVLGWLDGFRDHINVETILEPFVDDGYEHHILPRSLNQPVRNKEQFGAYMQELRKILKSFIPTVLGIVESSDSSQVVVHASSEAESITGSRHANEYMLTFHFVPTEDKKSKPKIKKIEEFVDSQLAAGFLSEVAKLGN